MLPHKPARRDFRLSTTTDQLEVPIWHLKNNGKLSMKRRNAKRHSKFKSDAANEKDRMEAVEGIKRGLESMKRNAGKPAEEFFKEFFAEKGISKPE